VPEVRAIYKPGGGDPPTHVSVLVDEADAWVAKWVWRVTHDGHVYRNVSWWDARLGMKRCRREYLHRFLMGLKPHHRRCVDHLNNNGLDNRRSNLQVVTRKVNTLRAYRRDGAGSAWTERPLRRSEVVA
jgi:hypothetical protein